MEKLENTLITVNEIARYFNATIIGSVLLKDLINNDLINDVDISIDESKFWNVKTFLQDKGFKETNNSYKQRGYADFIGSKKFESKNNLPIHLCFKDKDFKIKTIPEILKEKLERYSDSDRLQILDLVTNNYKLKK